MSLNEYFGTVRRVSRQWRLIGRRCTVSWWPSSRTGMVRASTSWSSPSRDDEERSSAPWEWRWISPSWWRRRGRCDRARSGIGTSWPRHRKGSGDWSWRSRCPWIFRRRSRSSIFYRYGTLAECSDAFAHMYGLAAASVLVGARLDEILPRSEPRNREHLRTFVRRGYSLADATSSEKDHDRAANGSSSIP